MAVQKKDIQIILLYKKIFHYLYENFRKDIYEKRFFMKRRGSVEANIIRPYFWIWANIIRRYSNHIILQVLLATNYHIRYR